MAPQAPIFKKAYLSLFLGLSFYALALLALTNPWLQRHVMYVHKLHLPQAWATDIDKPEKFGFAKNQVSPFNFTTVDGETIYAWHIMPLGLYAKHESEILKRPSGFVDDISHTKGFELLRDDPNARLIINSDCKTDIWKRGPGRTNSFISGDA
ncbi:hypothetical protein BOTCAL_0239g00130 [Botryotinia calthae]|uniref:Uncharacterized protein n=1 Tax=Botryotinia calthae TaxID=38488 RepID=A0A4Y8CY17_9HELO|nr:hypothetical protein BOTCAL_0239g00130 [Botryotinia calthae]